MRFFLKLIYSSRSIDSTTFYCHRIAEKRTASKNVLISAEIRTIFEFAHMTESSELKNADPGSRTLSGSRILDPTYIPKRSGSHFGSHFGSQTRTHRIPVVSEPNLSSWLASGLFGNTDYSFATTLSNFRRLRSLHRLSHDETCLYLLGVCFSSQKMV